MPPPRPSILLCTVGTSFATAGFGKSAPDPAAALRAAEPHERACGAEVNSIHSLIAKGYARPDAGVYFFHSDTDVGRSVAATLADYYRGRGHAPVEAVAVPDLQDADAKRFRTHGLRNLARLLCRAVRDHGAGACAVNATGGYKAQIAVAVLLGQAVGVPVYYKHELFDEVIAFPPLPVSFDFGLWMRASGLLDVLARETDPVPADDFAGEWDERYEPLVARTELDGRDYLELSAAGQVFHEAFRDRYRSDRDAVLPPPAAVQRPPVLHDHGVINLLKTSLTRHLQAATDAVPQVVQCVTNYCNPDLPERTRFRLQGDQVEGIYSDGSRTVKFAVLTTATTAGQRAAVVAALSMWLDSQR